MALNHNDSVSESLLQDTTRQKLGDYDLVTNPMMHPAEFLEKEAAEAAANLAIAGHRPWIKPFATREEGKRDGFSHAQEQLRCRPRDKSARNPCRVL